MDLTSAKLRRLIIAGKQAQSRLVIKGSRKEFFDFLAEKLAKKEILFPGCENPETVVKFLYEHIDFRKLSNENESISVNTLKSDLRDAKKEL